MSKPAIIQRTDYPETTCHCGKVFNPVRAFQKYCCRACNAKAHNDRYYARKKKCALEPSQESENAGLGGWGLDVCPFESRELLPDWQWRKPD